MDERERARCAATAALLKAGQLLAALAGLLAAVALLHVPMLPLVLLPGLACGYLAFRLRLDQALFEALAEGRIASLEALDDALQVVGLRRHRPGPTRGLGDRIAGTRRLLLGLALAVALQLVILVIGLSP